MWNKVVIWQRNTVKSNKCMTSVFHFMAMRPTHVLWTHIVFKCGIFLMVLSAAAANCFNQRRQLKSVKLIPVTCAMEELLLDDIQSAICQVYLCFVSCVYRKLREAMNAQKNAERAAMRAHFRRKYQLSEVCVYVCSQRRETHTHSTYWMILHSLFKRKFPWFLKVELTCAHP